MPPPLPVMLRKLDIDLQYAPLLDGPPPHYGDLYKTACAGDEVTIKTWRDTWIKNYTAARDRFGSFEEKSMGLLAGINQGKPAVVIGSGPSLKESLPELKENAKRGTGKVLTVSCLHNFGLFEDEDCHSDYYLSLDSGGVVIDDVSESRNKDGGFYWEQTKGKILLASIASDPKLFDLWQGELFLFNFLLPDQQLREEINKIERMSHYISAGGNALGACMYVAKAVMGSPQIIYVGADFCFDHDMKFHSYGTHYDNAGQTVPWRDVYSLPRRTWNSYLGFKFWFDHIACSVPGHWISCSEGIMGAYPEGIIRQFQYMPLKNALYPHKITEEVEVGNWVVNGANRSLESTTRMNVKEFFKDSKQPLDITLF